MNFVLSSSLNNIKSSGLYFLIIDGKISGFLALLILGTKLYLNLSLWRLGYDLSASFVLGKNSDFFFKMSLKGDHIFWEALEKKNAVQLIG